MGAYVGELVFYILLFIDKYIHIYVRINVVDKLYGYNTYTHVFIYFIVESIM